MTVQADRARECMLKLESSGYELLDLGRDFASDEHLYYILDHSSGDLAKEKVFCLADVERFISSLR